jgi:hypothetical protein
MTKKNKYQSASEFFKFKYSDNCWKEDITCDKQNLVKIMSQLDKKFINKDKLKKDIKTITDEQANIINSKYFGTERLAYLGATVELSKCILKLLGGEDETK